MSRIIQPRRARTKQQTSEFIESFNNNNVETNSNNKNIYSEMYKDKKGDVIVDLSGGSSVTNIDETMFKHIKEMNKDASDKPLGEDVYQNVFDTNSSYKQNLINKMIHDVREETKHLYLNSNEQRSFEDQIQFTQHRTSNAQNRRVMEDMKQMISTNNAKFSKK